MTDAEELFEARPRDKEELWWWVRGKTGVAISRRRVCANHSAPLDMFAQQVLNRPPIALWHGPRGSGKSFLSAIDTHITSRFNPRHGTRILGGSKAQASQVYTALNEAVIDARDVVCSDAHTIDELLKEECRYHNGSVVSILAASPKSVRGPHVQSLKQDEVDEIDPRVREDSLGMCMEKHGQSASILMTSTWHKPGGPMSELIERGRGGEFPVHTYCVWEVLERCPDERSGSNLEHCPACPLVSWCHSDRDSHASGKPKAKRSRGHYTIDSLIQKARAASERVFRSDYLCLGPQVAGAWFDRFDESRNVSELADYDPALPVHVSIDSGVWTGAVFFQARELTAGFHGINVFAEYLAFNNGAQAAALDIKGMIESLCPNAKLRVSTDSAGGARNPVGMTVVAEYELAGLKGERGLEFWPRYDGSVVDGLNLIESFVRAADGSIFLAIHPRCRKLIEAMGSYSRKSIRGQWLEIPEDPQHPHEDLIDPLRGGLKLEFPDSRRPRPNHPRVHASRFF